MKAIIPCLNLSFNCKKKTKLYLVEIRLKEEKKGRERISYYIRFNPIIKRELKMLQK
jgi:hypothetical protein